MGGLTDKEVRGGWFEGRLNVKPPKYLSRLAAICLDALMEPRNASLSVVFMNYALGSSAIEKPSCRFQTTFSRFEISTFTRLNSGFHGGPNSRLSGAIACSALQTLAMPFFGGRMICHIK